MSNTLEILRHITHSLALGDPAPLAQLGTLPRLEPLEAEYLRTHLLSSEGLPETPRPSKGRRPCLVVDMHLSAHSARISQSAEHEILLGVAHTVPEVRRMWKWDPSLVLPENVQPDATLHLVQPIAYELSENDRIISPREHILKEVFQRQVWCAECLDNRDFILESHLDQHEGAYTVRTPRQWMVDWICANIGVAHRKTWGAFAMRYMMALKGVGFRE